MKMKSQRGYTLLETGLVIAASIIMGGTVIGVMNATGEGSKEQEAANQFQTIAQVAGDQTGRGAIPATGIDQAIIATGQIPEGWIARDGGVVRIRGSWGGVITVDTVRLLAGSAHADGVRINAAAMSPSMCARMLMGTSPGAWESRVGGALFKAPDASLAMTRDRAATLCANSPSQIASFTFPAR